MPGTTTQFSKVNTGGAIRSEERGPGADRYKEIRQLRYVGFRHLDNERHFRFERISPGAPTQSFEMAANLALFHSLRIGIQEGPALCMRLIAAELEAGRNWEDLACCPLTEQHMRDYLASKPVPGAKAAKTPRRPSVYSAPAPWNREVPDGTR